MCTPKEERLTALVIPAVMGLIDEVGAESAATIALAPFDYPEFRERFGEWSLGDLLDAFSPCHDELL